MDILILVVPLTYVLAVVGLGVTLALTPVEGRLPRAARGLRRSALTFVLFIVPGVVGDAVVQSRRPSVPHRCWVPSSRSCRSWLWLPSWPPRPT